MDTLNEGTPLADEASIAGEADRRPDAVADQTPRLPDEIAVGDASADAGDGDDAADSRRPRTSYQRLKRRTAQLAAENAELLRLAAQARGEAENDAPAPKEADFDGDPAAYAAALAVHNARQAIREEFRRQEQGRLAARQSEALREIEEAHYERIDEARERIADFDETLARMRGVPVPAAVIREIMASDKSALLAYHYARNPDELAELSHMSEREIARAVGRLEGSERLALPQPRRQTQAPAPLSQLKGGAAPKPDPDRMTMSDYRRWREAGGGR